VEAPDSLWEWITAGNAPTYLAVVGAAVAAIIAWRSLQASKKSAATAQQQLARLERLDERDQASKFSIWVKETSNVYENMHPSFEDLDLLNLGCAPRAFTLAVRNASDHSIYRAIAFTYVKPPSGPESDVDIMPVGILPAIPPDEGRHITYESQCLATVRSRTVGVVFIDAQGREWERTPQGELLAHPSGTFDAFRDSLFQRYSSMFPAGNDSTMNFLMVTSPLFMKMKTESDADVTRSAPDPPSNPSSAT
jgi:hypothetical protein